MKHKMIPIPEEWLKELVELSNKTLKEMKKLPNELLRDVMVNLPHLSFLIGFSSSAKGIIKSVNNKH